MIGSIVNWCEPMVSVVWMCIKYGVLLILVWGAISAVFDLITWLRTGQIVIFGSPVEPAVNSTPAVAGGASTTARPATAAVSSPPSLASWPPPAASYPRPPAKPRPERRQPPGPPRGTPVRFLPGKLSRVGVRFALDECATAVLDRLRDAGLDVISAQEAGLCGSSDPEQLRHAAGERRIFVTFDRDFLRLDREMLHAGILYCEGGPTRANQREVLRLCLLMAARDGHRTAGG